MSCQNFLDISFCHFRHFDLPIIIPTDNRSIIEQLWKQ
nr:MAG TPA: hypothetical protein [Caudoviricetes sp.]